MSTDQTTTETVPDPTKPPSQFGLLESRRFLPLFVTQFLGAFNDNAFKNALVILITYVAAAKSGMKPEVLVPVVAGLFILPFFLFSASAGQLADKYDKAMLIRWIKVAEIVLMSLAALGFVLQSVGFLMVVLFLMGTQSTFFGPLKYSILPDQLTEKELIGGNALIESATFIAIIIGTIVGGLLILTQAGAWLVGGLIIAVAVCGWLSSRFILSTQPANPELRLDHNFRTPDLADGRPRRAPAGDIPAHPGTVLVLVRRRHLHVAGRPVCQGLPGRRPAARDPLSDRVRGGDRVRVAHVQPAAQGRGARELCAAGRAGHGDLLYRSVLRDCQRGGGR